MVRSAGAFGVFDAVAFKLSRARSGCDGRLAMIDRSTQVAILARGLDLLALGRNGSEVMLVSRGIFLSRGARGDAAAASVVADVIDGHVCDGFLVHVMHDSDIHVADFTIVEEAITIPAAADVAHTEVAEAVIYAAIEADRGTPVAVIENVAVPIPAPVSGSPQVSGLRRQNPGSGNPVIVVDAVIPSPVAGDPDVAVARTGGLNINGQRRRGKSHDNSDTRRSRHTDSEK